MDIKRAKYLLRIALLLFTVATILLVSVMAFAGNGNGNPSGIQGVLSVTGTAGQITVSTTSGAVTVSLPSTITSNETFSGTLNLSALTASQLLALDGSKNIVNVTALPNGTTATTQTVGDNSTKVATDAFVLANAGSATITLGTSAAATNPQRSGQVDTGLYSATSGHVSVAVDVSGTGTQVADFLSTGLNLPTGETYQINGAQIACSNLSNGATGCSTATGTSGATLEVNNANNTVSGNDIYSGTSLYTGAPFTIASNGQATIGASATGGAVIEGQGSSNDFTLENKSGASACTLGTGTTTLNCVGLQVGGVAVLTGNQSITLTGPVTGSGTTSIATTIGANQVTLTNLAQAGANTMVGNWTSGTANEVANSMPSCPDSGGNHLNYVSGTGVICGTGGSNAITLGTSAAATNPQRSGQAGTGLYSDTSNVVEIGANSQPVANFTGIASGADYFTLTNAATANPATVTIAATGSDSNINIAMTPKGTGILSTLAPVAIGTTSQNGTVPEILTLVRNTQVGFEFKDTASGGHDWHIDSDDNGQTTPGAVAWFDQTANATPFAFTGVAFGTSEFATLSGFIYCWTSATQYTTLTCQTDISQPSAGVIDFDTSSVGNTAAKLQANAYQVTGSGKANVNAAMAAVMEADFGGL